MVNHELTQISRKSVLLSGQWINFRKKLNTMMQVSAVMCFHALPRSSLFIALLFWNGGEENVTVTYQQQKSKDLLPLWSFLAEH